MDSLGEFELIARYFTRPSRERSGVGDDCALLDCADRTLALSTDMLLEGRHFFSGADPSALGHKALAVNLSDLAAAGATPRCFLLALGLPHADPVWLEAFAGGLFELAERHDCELVGGDTTRSAWLARLESAQSRPAEQHGPLTICITVVGEAPLGSALRRTGAAGGDDIWVSGMLGDAALALLQARGGPQGSAPAAELSEEQGAAVRARLDRPEPRVALGSALRGVASACIDVSDGLLGDLAHILERSGAGAVVHWDRVPRSPALAMQPDALQQRCALAGGDDYELLFTAPPARREQVLTIGRTQAIDLALIGQITQTKGLVVVDAAGCPLETTYRAYEHFAANGR